MQDLRLVGVHDDGEHVVLVGSDGGRYRLRVDEALRAAVRRDRARLAQLQIQTGAQLRPRDIQARIRAGESAEEIAASAEVTLEHVRRYEGPVLAERAHVAGLARRAPFGRGSAADSLDEVVVARLSARAVDPDGARWDSWREEDGAWTVQVEFVAGGRGRVARWAFDPGSRSLTARDDEARWLSEEEPAETGPLPTRRLVSVVGDGTGRPASERVYDVEADGGVRAAAERGRREPLAGGRTDDLLDALDAQRGVRGTLPGPDTEDDDAAAPRVDALLADPPPAHPAASASHEFEDRTVLPAPAAGGAEPAGEPVEEVGEPAEEAAEVDDVVDADPAEPVSGEPGEDLRGDLRDEPAQEDAVDGAAQEPAPRRRNRSARRGGGQAASKRASVPSWDEIMFGAKKE